VTAARLAARCVELLGAVDGPVAVVARRRVRAALAAQLRLADDGAPAPAALCVFLGESVDCDTRRTRLDGLAARVPPGAPLVAVDHNQPRARWRRLPGALVLLTRGQSPARARHPVARELQTCGFTIERLRLASGERVQLVLARRRVD